jgi:hypothetical protein
LAEGDIVFLMRTLDKRRKLTNNTRLLILDIKARFIKVQTLGDHPLAQTHLIPRITFSFKMHRRKALTIDRLQFPLRLAYAMTLNRAQGQTLDKVRVDGTSRLLRKHDCHGAFTHGQCNVAISRVRRREDIAILVDEHNIVTDAKTGVGPANVLRSHWQRISFESSNRSSRHTRHDPAPCRLYVRTE